jgi:hypothetical protein
MCAARNYTQVVTEQMYNHTWLAPASNSPASLEVISTMSEEELVKVNMMVIGPLTIGWFPSVAILYVSLVCLISELDMS